jgi:hypothetical protein
VTRARGTPAVALAVATAVALTETSRAAETAPRRWAVEARLGNAWNAPLAARVRQPGAATLNLDPRWSTRGFRTPLYYGVRVARIGARATWAVDLTHHKLFLENPPAEVQTFSISHGYNLLTIQRWTERRRWFWGGGAGVVVAHPESEVHGRRFDERRGLFRDGYFAAGPTLAGFAGRTLGSRDRLRLVAESRLTYSHAEVPIAGGHARVPNLALHGAAGARW